MTSNNKSKTKSKSKSKKTTARKSPTKKKAAAKQGSTKRTGTRKKAARKAGARTTGSRKAAASRAMPPVELFEAPTAQATKQMAGTAVAEPWHESEPETSSLPDLMARSITESLAARSPAVSETLDTNATTAGSPTWRAFQASTRKQTGLVGRSLNAVWNFVVALLGAPPPAKKAG